MADFIGGFIRCTGNFAGERCGKLHTVDGAANTVHGCPRCGADIRSQAWRDGRTVATTTSALNW